MQRKLIRLATWGRFNTHLDDIAQNVTHKLDIILEPSTNIVGDIKSKDEYLLTLEG